MFVAYVDYPRPTTAQDKRLKDAQPKIEHLHHTPSSYSSGIIAEDRVEEKAKGKVGG